MRILIITALFVLSACSQENMLEQFASKEDQASAKARIEQLRSRDFNNIEEDIDVSLKSPNLQATLEKMASLFPNGAPTSITLVGAHISSGPDSNSKNLSFEYNFGGKWLLINVATKEKGGAKTIVGMSVTPMAESLEQQNRFTFLGRSAKHYAMLMSTMAAALISLYALIICVRTEMPGRKWPWLVFILLGIGKLSLNWSSGEIFFAPLSIQFFSASAAAALYGPWIISVSLPLGAIVFLFRQKALNASQQVA